LQRVENENQLSTNEWQKSLGSSIFDISLSDETIPCQQLTPQITNETFFQLVQTNNHNIPQMTATKNGLSYS
jgi:hypothetical protein